MVDRYWLKNLAMSLILVWLPYQTALGHLRLPFLQLFPISATQTNNCCRGVILLRYHRLIWCESGLRLNKQTVRDQPEKKKKAKQGAGGREREMCIWSPGSWLPIIITLVILHTSFPFIFDTLHLFLIM